MNKSIINKQYNSIKIIYYIINLLINNIYKLHIIIPKNINQLQKTLKNVRIKKIINIKKLLKIR
jgi:hypothetical protein